MINPKIIKIREKLDKLDNKLLKIIKLRMNLVNQVLKQKTLKNKLLIRKELELF